MEAATATRPPGTEPDDGLGGPDTPPAEDPTPPAADLPDDGDAQGAEKEAAQEAGIVLDGDRQLSLTIGGKSPTSSVLKLKGGKLDLEGMFHKGDQLRVVLDLRVGAVKVEDSIDSSSREVKSTLRTHWATIEGVQRVAEDEEE